jgi:uncharacterized membrane protein YeiH
MTQEQLGNFITLAAVGLFAVSGVLAGLGDESDIFSLVVFGVVSALGGGTIRDVLLGAPVFWTADLAYVWVAIGASILAFFVYRSAYRAQTLLLYLDAAGISLFTVQTINKVLGLNFPPIIALIMGVITGIGGGLIRDVLTDRPNLLMRKELYATPILLGGLVYLLMLQFAPSVDFAWLVAMVFIFAVRSAAIYWELTLPRWLTANTPSRGVQQ